MNQKLPPWPLVKAWLDIQHELDIPQSIREKRLKLIIYFFSSIESAFQYIDQHADLKEISRIHSIKEYRYATI